MVSEQHRVMTTRQLGDGIAQRLVAWRKIRHQRQRSDAYDVVGGQRWQHVVRIDVSKAANGDRVGGVQVHYRAGPRGRASCRARVCTAGGILVVAGSYKKK